MHVAYDAYVLVGGGARKWKTQIYTYLNLPVCMYEIQCRFEYISFICYCCKCIKWPFGSKTTTTFRNILKKKEGPNEINRLSSRNKCKIKILFQIAASFACIGISNVCACVCCCSKISAFPFLSLSLQLPFHFGLCSTFKEKAKKKRVETKRTQRSSLGKGLKYAYTIRMVWCVYDEKCFAFDISISFSVVVITFCI